MSALFFFRAAARYEEDVRCTNCGATVCVMVPRGVPLQEYLRRHSCPKCGKFTLVLNDIGDV